MMATCLFKLLTKTKKNSNPVKISYTRVACTEKEEKRKPIGKPPSALALRISLKIWSSGRKTQIRVKIW